MQLNAHPAPRPRTGAPGDEGAARALVSTLPAYQVALWPDGWLLDKDGRVHIRDTHRMAEARRWRALVHRNAAGRAPAAGSAARTARIMRLHGIYVPGAVIDMAGRCLPSEQVASVALTLAAGDWIDERRRELASAPLQALAERALGWRGSRHHGTPDPAQAQALLQQVLAQCVGERLLPPARYQVSCRPADGYGVGACRCIIEVGLDPYARARAADVLQTALIPWNRAIVRDGKATPAILVEVRAPASGRLFSGKHRC